jgi:hypothetical protein
VSACAIELYKATVSVSAPLFVSFSDSSAPAQAVRGSAPHLVYAVYLCYCICACCVRVCAAPLSQYVQSTSVTVYALHMYTCMPCEGLRRTPVPECAVYFSHCICAVYVHVHADRGSAPHLVYAVYLCYCICACRVRVCAAPLSQYVQCTSVTVYALHMYMCMPIEGLRRTSSGGSVAMRGPRYCRACRLRRLLRTPPPPTHTHTRAHTQYNHL